MKVGTRRTRPKSWFVESTTRLSQVLANLGEGEQALREGRVFVNRRRVADLELVVNARDRVDVAHARTGVDSVRVLEQRDGWVLIEKPCGIPTEPDRATSGGSVVHQVARALNMPKTRVHAVTRLDLAASGVVLLTTTPEARRSAANELVRGGVDKRYLAVVSGAVERDAGVWGSALLDRSGTPKSALTRYRTLHKIELVSGAPAQGLTLLELTLDTGRLHQIRRHSAEAGHPLLGDVRYGGPKTVRLATGEVIEVPRLMLHAWSLSIALPTTTLRAQAAVPEDMRRLWVAVGGHVDALAMEQARAPTQPR